MFSLSFTNYSDPYLMPTKVTLESFTLLCQIMGKPKDCYMLCQRNISHKSRQKAGWVSLHFFFFLMQCSVSGTKKKKKKKYCQMCKCKFNEHLKKSLQINAKIFHCGVILIKKKRGREEDIA